MTAHQWQYDGPHARRCPVCNTTVTRRRVWDRFVYDVHNAHCNAYVVEERDTLPQCIGRAA